MNQHNSHKIEYYITQEVYIKNDEQQKQGTIIGIDLLPHSSVIYNVSFGNSNTDRFYGFELSSEIDTVKKVS